MTGRGFDLKALYAAADEQRRARGLTWAAAAREINRGGTGRHPIAVSTITGLATKTVAEGDGVLQMLRWLDRTPESFVPGMEDANNARFRLTDPGAARLLRWDVPAIHAALDAERHARGLTWQSVAAQIGGVTPAMLTNLAKTSRIGFPGVMHIVRWLAVPAATFTCVSDW
ncbi:MAG TPA: hypothetical protein VKE70_33190 [Candidatus Solibacter sp.]|nr:hypothetical protein [Candidatus Solibacter sp.]